MRLKLLMLLLASSTRITAAAINMSDSVSEFISSLETDDTVAKSVESVLNGDAEEVQSLAGDRQLGTAKKACLISKLVLGENAFLSNASIQPLVERSWYAMRRL